MTDADVRAVIETAWDKHRVRIDDYDAAVCLQAEEILDKDPDNADAQTVVRNFSVWMRTGIKQLSFAEFSLPCPLTAEERAASEARRLAFLAATGEQNADRP